MLKVLSEKGWINVDVDAHIIHEFNGNKILDFTISQVDENYKYFKNEVVIECDGLYFNTKLNDCENDDFARIEAILNKDDFLKHMYNRSFILETKTLIEFLEYALMDTGWTYLNAGIRSYRRTLDLKDKDVSKLDILIEIANLFNVTYDFDNKNKRLTIIDVNESIDKGFYITDQVNLKSMQYTSDTYEFVTRIYGYGKSDENDIPITFASINGGKEFVEDLTYTNKVISTTFRDERFTNPESLLAHCKEKLEQLSKPVESYQLEIINLSKTNPDDYYLLNYRNRDIVKLLDKKRNQVVTYKIIQLEETQNHPELDVITLSEKPLNIVDVNKTLQSQIATLNNVVQKNDPENFLTKAKEEAAALMQEFATKGNRYETENETYFLDKLPKETAKYVMRMNLGGIAFSKSGWNGPYTTAWTIDGKFNADFVTTGTLKAIRIESVDIFGGNIEGTNIKSSSFVVEKERVVEVYAGEQEQIMNYIIGTGTLTEEQKLRLDINQNGKIDSLDYMLAGHIYNGVISGRFVDTITINSDVLPEIKLKTTNGKNTFETIIKTGSLNTDYVDATDGEFNSLKTYNIRFRDDSSAYVGFVERDGIDTFTIEAVNKPTAILGSSVEIDGTNALKCNRAWQITSDARLKHDITNIPEELLEVWMNIQPKMFKLNNSSSSETMIGLIAQDVIKEFENANLDFKEYSFIGELKIDAVGNKYFCVSYDFYFILTSLATKKLYEEVKNIKEKMK